MKTRAGDGDPRGPDDSQFPPSQPDPSVSSEPPSDPSYRPAIESTCNSFHLTGYALTLDSGNAKAARIRGRVSVWTDYYANVSGRISVC